MPAYVERTPSFEETIRHVYLMEGDKVLAYMKHGTTDVKYFKSPLQIDKRGRTFEKLSFNPFKQLQKANTKEVAGSNGNVYVVNLDDKTCSCPGFT